MSRLFSSILFMAAVGLTINLGAGCSDHNVTPTKAVADGVVEAPVTDPQLLKALADNARATADNAKAINELKNKVGEIGDLAINDDDKAAIAKLVTDGIKGPDADSDGIIDVDDKCKDDAEDKDGFEDDDGCLDPDNDGDNILDADDKCPSSFGWLSTDATLVGCPDAHADGDADKDGILNKDDKCDDKAGVANDDPEKNGCPSEETPPAPATPPETPPPATDEHCDDDKPAKVVKVLTLEERVKQLEDIKLHGIWDAIARIDLKNAEQDAKDRVHDELLAKYGQRLSDGWTASPPTPPLPAAPGAVSLGEPEVIVKP